MHRVFSIALNSISLYNKTVKVVMCAQILCITMLSKITLPVKHMLHKDALVHTRVHELLASLARVNHDLEEQQKATEWLKSTVQ